MSLKYGLAEKFNINQIIDTAISENPEADIYLKIHPDVINLKKKTDLDLKKISYKCKIISEDINSISLLEHFKKSLYKNFLNGFWGIDHGM